MDNSIEVKRCMFNETCPKKPEHTVTLRDHTVTSTYKPKYTAHLCAGHFNGLGWSATVWTEKKA